MISTMDVKDKVGQIVLQFLQNLASINLLRPEVFLIEDILLLDGDQRRKKGWQGERGGVHGGAVQGRLQHVAQAQGADEGNVWGIKVFKTVGSNGNCCRKHF